MKQDRGPTEAEVNADVRKFETKWNLFTNAVDGVCVWQLIRFEVSLRKQRGGLRRASMSRWRLLKGTIRGLVQYLLPATRHLYLCKTYDSAHRGIVGGRSIDIYFDAICDQVAGGAKISSYDAAGFEDRVSIAKRRTVFDDTAVIVLSAFLGRWLPFRKADPGFELLARALVQEFGFSDYTPARLARSYNVFRWRAFLYRLLLQKFEPSVVLAPDSGQFALMSACSGLGIAFIELQHGVFTSVHPNVLPKELPEKAKLIKPSILAAYGNFTRDALQNSALEGEARIVAVGAPSVERARALRDTDFRPSEDINVIVTTQGIAAEEICKFLQAFLEKATVKIRMHVKLHPAYDAEEVCYRMLLGDDPRVTIISGKANVSTHELIALSDLHLSISSASHYDALGIGTPTGIIPFETYQSIEEILRYEGAFLVEDPDSLAAVVTQRGWPMVPTETKDHFFVGGFMSNVEKLLKSQIDRVRRDPNSEAKK